MKVVAYAVFKVKDVALHFNVDVSGGRIQTAALELSGAAGFAVHFETAASADFNGNIHQTGIAPIDLSIPVGGFGVPISVHLIQSLSLNTGFSARTSLLTADGEYFASGSVLVGYVRGSWGGAPPLLGTKQNLAEHVGGISVGINSLAFALRQEVLVGVGVLGFSAGPYLALTTGTTALKQSSVAMIDCRQATFTMDLTAGAGYTLPKPLVSVFNFFLRAVHAKELSPNGSIAENDAAARRGNAQPKAIGMRGVSRLWQRAALSAALRDLPDPCARSIRFGVLELRALRCGMQRRARETARPRTAQFRATTS